MLTWSFSSGELKWNIHYIFIPSSIWLRCNVKLYKHMKYTYFQFLFLVWHCRLWSIMFSSLNWWVLKMILLSMKSPMECEVGTVNPYNCQMECRYVENLGQCHVESGHTLLKKKNSTEYCKGNYTRDSYTASLTWVTLVLLLFSCCIFKAC